MLSFYFGGPVLRASLLFLAVIAAWVGFKSYQNHMETLRLLSRAEVLRTSPLFLEPAMYASGQEPLRQNQMLSLIQKELGPKEADRYLELHYQRYCPDNVSECLPRFAMRADGKWYFRGYCRIFSGSYDFKSREAHKDWAGQNFPAVAYEDLKFKLEQTQNINCARNEKYLTQTEYEYLVSLLHAKRLLIAYPLEPGNRAAPQPKLIFETESHSRIGWSLPESRSQLPLRLPAATRIRLSSSSE